MMLLIDSAPPADEYRWRKTFMISPVSHANPAPKAEPAAANNPKPAASNAQTNKSPAQDKVTLSHKTADVDHDGDTK